jgi:hypothetical protein
MDARTRIAAILLALSIGAGATLSLDHAAQSAYKDPTGDDRARPTLALKAPPLRYGNAPQQEIGLKAPPLRHEA